MPASGIIVTIKINVLQPIRYPAHVRKICPAAEFLSAFTLALRWTEIPSSIDGKYVRLIFKMLRAEKSSILRDLLVNTEKGQSFRSPIFFRGKFR